MESLPFQVVSKLYTNVQSFANSASVHVKSYVTQGQAERLIYDSVQEIESGSVKPSLQETSRFDFPELQRAFPTTEKVHYLKYLSALSAKDWESAVDSLHRYFDYFFFASHSMLRGGASDSSGPITLASYAALNLAAVHYRFGHRLSAIQAVHEAVRIAHQNNEHEALTVALSLLFKLANAEGAVSEAQWLLMRCITQSGALKLSALLCKTLLSRAQSLAISIDPNPTDSLLLLLDSPLSSLSSSSSTSIKISHAIWKNIKQSYRYCSQGELIPMLRTTALTSAAVWELFGNKEMVGLFECFFFFFFPSS